MNKHEAEIFNRYARLLEYLGAATHCVFCPEELLPASKEKIKEVLKIASVK